MICGENIIHRINFCTHDLQFLVQTNNYLMEGLSRVLVFASLPSISFLGYLPIPLSLLSFYISVIDRLTHPPFVILTSASPIFTRIYIVQCICKCINYRFSLQCRFEPTPDPGRESAPGSVRPAVVPPVTAIPTSPLPESAPHASASGSLVLTLPPPRMSRRRSSAGAGQWFLFPSAKLHLVA